MDVCGGGGGERRALASELAQVQAMVRELEACVDQDSPAAAREVIRELASSVDRSIHIAMSGGWTGPDSPGTGDGSPRSDGAQHPAALGGNAQSKRRQVERSISVSSLHRATEKGTPCVRRQVRVTSVQDMASLDDGLSWRKYGQKDILGAKYPRAYFRCTHRHSQGCLATKHVQRADGDPLLHDVVYHGVHTCAQAAHPTAEQLRQQLQPEGHTGQEQGSPLALEAEGLQAELEPMTPYSFASAAPSAGADFGGSFALLSPTGLEWQLRSSHAAGGLGVGMGFEAQFEEFFTNPTDPFQWDLYAAN
ncbi:putative WRKY transcription factor 30 [Dichanthelium oligosanthes]|uniref:Putative WRKY transcription factor 30 n=1 Tax=Dichanthelium oligosanthes TaxID=888268 RepID=A0A1E5UM37_9POAL|nr:putative WRKY transcription factor 30 [Dichanthelium oligosanthes]